MKKVIIVLVSLILFTIFASVVLQTPKEILYLLNWGEYINHDLVEKFEEEYNCQVIEENVISSEAMYQKITAKTTTYDVAIPGDYVILQLYSENCLLELDVNNEELENMSGYKTMFTDSLRQLIEDNMVSDSKLIDTYFMPYFWGAYSIIYSENNPEVKGVVEENGFNALYDRSLYNSEVKIGMYNTARWIVSSYLMAKGYNPNITEYALDNNNKPVKDGDLSIEIQNDVINALKTNRFDEFNDDQLKRNVANKSLDMCFTQLGDFFDVLYLVYDQNENPVIDFNVFIPDNSAAFFDGMIIPTTCHNYDLANQFINFMLDPDNAYQNATEIGYCPTLKSVCDLYRADALAGEYYYGDAESSISLTLQDFLDKYPMYLDPLINSKDVYILEPKSNRYLTTCETIYNNLS